jgi:hypothetical protein
VFASLGVSESLGKPKIDHIDVVLLFANANEEIVWLDISMQKVPRMDEFNSLEHLISKHKHCFERELAFAVVEEVLETGTQEIDDHHVVVSFNSEPVDVWNSNSSLQDAIELSLIQQLWMLGSYWFQFNSDFFVCFYVCAVVDVSKGTTAKFSRKSVLSSYS